MLTRQWQFGEFKGEDAATAVTTKILGEHTFINTLNFPNNVSFNYDGSLPLEAIVEREALMPGLALAVQMARHFIKLIKVKPGFAAALNLLMNEYPLNYAPAVNDDEGIQLLNSVSGKTFDGYAFQKAIIAGSVPASIVNDYSTEIEDFKSWYHRNYSQPGTGGDSAWLPSRLEYQFSVSATSGETVAKNFPLTIIRVDISIGIL